MAFGPQKTLFGFFVMVYDRLGLSIYFYLFDTLFNVDV